MEKCPHPECGYVTEFISKIHCRSVHGMERDEMFQKYGDPRRKGPKGIEFTPKTPSYYVENKK